MSEQNAEATKTRRIKKPLIFTLILLPIAVIGSYFAVLMTLSSVDKTALDEAIAQVGSETAVVLISMIQPIIITLLCGFFGYIISAKVGLMKPFTIERKKLLVSILASAVGGALLSLDAWTFGKWIPEVGKNYENAGSFDLVTWMASISYGGVIEEIMLRLFTMSLLSLIIWMLFFRKKEAIPSGIYIAANIISAVLFAAGHLPSTAILFGSISPLIVIRCMLLNSFAGLLFGRLYRNYGIQYAMLSHILFHLVSRTIWLITL